MRNNEKQEKGISLIALIVTIIVLIILSSVSINLIIGDDGLITKANDIKILQTIAILKEEIHIEALEKGIEGIKLTPETMLAEGKVKRTVQQGDDGNYYMYYSIKDEAYKSMLGLGKGNIASLKDVFLIDDALNIRYIAENGKEYGDTIENKILEDETQIRFSNKVFSEYISKISGVTEEEMQFKWMKSQTSLQIEDANVDSLEDLVFFPNLESLILGNRGDSSKPTPQVTTLDGVENCTKLERIYIISGPNKDYTALTYLPNLTLFERYVGNDYNNIMDALKLCPNLEEVTIRHCEVTDMSRISELGNLKRLSLQDNYIEKIVGLENMTNLEILNFQNNNISKIEGLEHLTKLSELNLNDNQITDILPLSANTSLTTLRLTKNAGIDGNRANYTGERLEALEKIGEILNKPDGKIYLDVDKIGLFTNYKALELSSQKLTTLEPLQGLTELETLNLSSNQITLEDEKSQEILKSMTKLETLYIYFSILTDITAINNLTNLKVLGLTGSNANINLAEIEDIISNLDNLIVSTKIFQTIVNCDANKITKLCLTANSYSHLTELPDLSKFTKLTYLKLNGHNTITDLSIISELTSLQTLDLYAMDLHGRMIDFSKLTNLTSLNLTNNSLWSEDLENLKALKNNVGLTINLRNNSIIDASALYELNPSTVIDLRGNKNLSSESKIELRNIFGSNVRFDE